MLRTASTRTNPRSTPRPLTGGRQERLLDSTPVLFRLPTVDTLPMVVPDLPADDIADTPATSTAAVTAIPHKAETVAIGSQVTVTPTTHATAPHSSAIENVASETKPAQEPQLFDQPRSWWEHWSSGVVLILLILALLVVSILAMKRPASNTRELMADQPAATNDLVIPTLEPQTSTTTVSLAEASERVGDATPIATRPSNAAPTSATPSTSIGAAQSGGLVNALPANMSTDTAAANAAPEQATKSLGGSAAPSVSPPVTSLSLVPGDMSRSASQADVARSNLANWQTATSTSTAASPSAAGHPLSLDVDLDLAASPDKPEIRSETEMAANRPNTASSATLSPPIGIEPPALFSEVELQFTESLPVAPVANQTPVPTVSGRSEPRLHDEAMSLPTSDPASLTAGSEWSQPSQLQPAGLDSSLTQAWPVASLASTADQPQFNTAESSTTNPPAGAQPAGMQLPPNVSSTAYPDLPADAIIRAWQKSKELNQSENNSANRYKTQTGTGATTTSPAATTSNAAADTRPTMPSANIAPANNLPVNTAVPSTGATAPVSGPYYPQLPNL